MKGPYVCSICQKHYHSEEEAKNCEGRHPAPVAIVSSQDYLVDEDYPNRILVEFSDGSRCYYSFDDREALEDPYHA